MCMYVQSLSTIECCELITNILKQHKDNSKVIEWALKLHVNLSSYDYVQVEDNDAGINESFNGNFNGSSQSFAVSKFKTHMRGNSAGMYMQQMKYVYVDVRVYTQDLLQPSPKLQVHKRSLNRVPHFLFVAPEVTANVIAVGANQPNRYATRTSLYHIYIPYTYTTDVTFIQSEVFELWSS